MFKKIFVLKHFFALNLIFFMDIKITSPTNFSCWYKQLLLFVACRNSKKKFWLAAVPTVLGSPHNPEWATQTIFFLHCLSLKSTKNPSDNFLTFTIHFGKKIGTLEPKEKCINYIKEDSTPPLLKAEKNKSRGEK